MKCDSKLKTYDDVIANKMLLTDYRSIIKSEFSNFVTLNEKHLTIIAKNYKAYCGTIMGKTENIEIEIYGSEGLSAFKTLAQKMNWQIFDKSLNSFT